MHVLISGGTGFIGKALQKKLHEAGHQTSILSRGKGNVAWDPNEHFLDENAFDGIDAIVHLAGENIGAKRWTASRKKEIIDSRVRGTQLLVEALNQRQHQVKTVIFASAIGYYGADTGDSLCTESSPAGSDFLAECVIAWEAAGQSLPNTIRSVSFRIGLVLDKKEGIFPQVANPVRWGIGSALGTGNQWQSWIHIDDLCAFFLQGIENNSLEGTYNAVAPQPLQQVAMAKAIAVKLNKPFFLPAVPAFVLKLALGEMACLVLGGNKVSCEKFVRASGYSFKYESLHAALENLL